MLQWYVDLWPFMSEINKMPPWASSLKKKIAFEAVKLFNKASVW